VVRRVVACVAVGCQWRVCHVVSPESVTRDARSGGEERERARKLCACVHYLGSKKRVICKRARSNVKRV
jgi:hypothetical protein